jgi:transcriptional regulator with XRE-family HTH domain
MNSDVRFRTLPFTDDPHEQAFRQVLDELAGSVRDLDRAEQDGHFFTEARAAARSLLRAWDALPPKSPYRDVVDEAGFILRELATAAWAFDPVVARDLEELRADIVLVDARCQVMKTVASVAARDGGLRKLAHRAGVSVGHLSELSNARGGLPRARTARAIDEAAGTAIEELVLAARADAGGIRQTARKREREATTRNRPPRPSTTDTLARINLAMAEEPELLALVARLLDVPRQARRALLDLLASFGQRD